MLNWLLRYQPVIQELEPLAPRSVLDVGSGWYGLSWYWPHPVVQTDLHFGDRPQDAERAGEARFVAARAEQLPFPDRSFDVVVSLDLMEHTPSRIRGQILAELARVATKGVVLAFPVGPNAERTDRRIQRATRLIPRQPVPGWLVEHLQQDAYPDEGLVDRLLPEGWHILSRRPLGNTAVQSVVVVGEMVVGLRRVLDALERRGQGRPLPPWVDREPAYRWMYVLERRG